MLRLDDETGVRLFKIVSILLMLALVPVALTRTTPPQLPSVSSFGIRRLYRSSPLGVAGVFISGAITGSIYGLAPVFGASSSFGVSGTALFMSVLILGGMALQWPLGRLSGRFDRRSVIIGLSAALSLSSLGMIAGRRTDPRCCAVRTFWNRPMTRSPRKRRCPWERSRPGCASRSAI